MGRAVGCSQVQGDRRVRENKGRRNKGRGDLMEEGMDTHNAKGKRCQRREIEGWVHEGWDIQGWVHELNASAWRDEGSLL